MVEMFSSHREQSPNAMSQNSLPAAREYNFDGIVGPTHNYAGLSAGNVASTTNRHCASNPRAAALQGLEKMKRVAALGVAQAVLPPQRRPCFRFLRNLGFVGTDRELIEKAAASDPGLLAAAYSASSMWTANAATISPSADCEDGRLHISVANLTSMPHRALEPRSTQSVLQFVFADRARFVVHPPLVGGSSLADEGAANHMRICSKHAVSGLEIFVYGRSSESAVNNAPRRYPARQSREASKAIARRHRLPADRVVFVQQNPVAIDAGVFHNDVIALSNENVLLYHEQAFADSDATILQRGTQSDRAGSSGLFTQRIATSDLSLDDAVKSYFFNSQLLTRGDGRMTLLCPAETQEIDSARRCAEAILAADNPIDAVEFIDLRQSMHNGGGPACLRLRVVMTPAEAAAIHPGVLFTDELYRRLTEWVRRHYRERISPEDLRDWSLAEESHAALNELIGILGLPTDTL